MKYLLHMPGEAQAVLIPDQRAQRSANESDHAFHARAAREVFDGTVSARGLNVYEWLLAD